MMWRAGLLLTLSLSLFAASCTHRKDSSKDLAVIKVNGETLTAQDLSKSLAKKLKNFDALAAKDPVNIHRAKDAIVRDFIVSALLHQYAKAHNISVAKEEVEAEIDVVRKTYPDDLTFKAGLATEGETLDDWESALGQTLLQRKVFVALAPTDKPSKEEEAETRKFYDSHKSEFSHPAQVHIQQIVVPREDDAERILHGLKTGSTFGELAKKFSVAPDGKEGGDIGFVAKGVDPIFDQAFNMKVGQTSNALKSSYGFHIIKLLDKKPAGSLTFEQVRAKLLRQTQAQRQQKVFTAWLENTVKEAKIQRDDVLLDKIKVRTEGEEE